MTLSSLEPSRYVMLSQPLPCTILVTASTGPHVDPDQTCPASSLGAVTGLAIDGLLLKIQPAAESRVEGSRTILISFDGQKEFRIEGLIKAFESDTMEVSVEDPGSKERLFDLLGLVRKGQHITICATMDVEASDRYTGFADVALRPKALPELAWDELDPSIEFLGKRFPLPLLITGMTGGLAQGAAINRRLALAAQHFGIPMGVGSQRVALENPDHAAIFAVKSFAPRLFLIGNVGIAQIRAQDGIEKCRRAVEMIEADALAIHVNVLQELVQVEGDRDFRDILAGIARVARALHVPVIVKEVGCGMDVETARALLETGIAAIDCGGKGGTSWSLIEGMRAKSPITQAIGHSFRDWGIPTGLSLATLHKAFPQVPLIATGGIRDGLTVAKAAALGATLCGIGLPIFKAALDSEDGPFSVLQTFTQGLRTAMLCAGSRDLQGLKQRVILRRPFREALLELEEGLFTP